MTNKRITELTALDGDDVANDDVLVIVDVSDTTMAASGTNKKITVAELVTDSALTGAFWPNSSTALAGSGVADADRLPILDGTTAKYIEAGELAQATQFSSRYKPLVSDRVWLTAQQFTAISGSAVMGTIGNAGAAERRVPAFLFDQTNFEFVGTTFVMPLGWASFSVHIWWSNAGAGAGDVSWAHYTLPFATTENTDVARSAVFVAPTAPAQYTLQRNSFSGSVSATAGELVSLNIMRNGPSGTDTLANDAAMVAIELVRAS